VPQRVIEEYFQGDNTRSGMPIFQRTFAPAKAKLESELLPFFNFDSSSGEIWVISYGLQNPNSVCVIDEDFGRSLCELFDLNFTGTIGILKKMKQMKLLCNSELKRTKRTIKTCGFFLSKQMSRELDALCET
jgi:predicted nucleic acid-binding protein